VKQTQPFRAEILFPRPEVPDLGLREERGPIRVKSSDNGESSGNGTSDVPLITIADRDGTAKVVRVDARFWWEEDEERDRRKSMPIEIKTFEC
jgi:hypothetical protein